MQNVSVICSITTLTAISLERYAWEVPVSKNFFVRREGEMRWKCISFAPLSRVLILKKLGCQFNISSCICSNDLLVFFNSRYYAILYPMKAKYICTKDRTRRVIVLLWALSFALAAPIIYGQVTDTQRYELKHPNGDASHAIIH